MDHEEELIPEDDSVYDAVVADETFNASDAILEDSFSSLPEEINQTIPLSLDAGATSTPQLVTRSKSRLVASPECSTRTRGGAAASPRSRARLSTPIPESYSALPDSPSRTRSRTRNTSPAPPPTGSPSSRTRSRTRNISPAPPPIDSPSSRTRSRITNTSPARPPVSSSSSHGSDRSRSRTRGISPLSQATASSSSSRRGGAATASTSRIKCSECPTTLANERTFQVHKRMHTLKRVFSRAAKQDKFMEELPSLMTKGLESLLQEKFVGKWATPLQDFCKQVRDTFNNLEEEHQDLCNYLCEPLYGILLNHGSVFSSSLVHSFYIGVNKLLNDSEFMVGLQNHIVALGHAQPPSPAVISLFLGHYMHVLSSQIVIYFIRTIHGASANDVIRKKRSGDKVTSTDFLELSYYIGGCVVHTFLRKSLKFSSDNWKHFRSVLEERFKRTAGVGSVVTSEVSHFTDKVDRGKLTHISQEALDFFVVLFDFLMSLEGNDGSLPVNVVDENVLQDDTILCLWDVLVGSHLEDDASLDFLIQMSETCKRIVIKGIMTRRLNDNIRKAVAAVPLRSRLAE
ncbi:hypothetical protein ONE63_011277 [Megalurothrips usitatus]|uniref:C2H2-type domain-containing protein n=1 Tax=Megalurothrips usitatus TaxID=439358 RepID=A0AAV7X2Z2_9NEOP|nr:hypothetical protein ONE63_011277 [Megalurothrips usitatus]